MRHSPAPGGVARLRRLAALRLTLAAALGLAQGTGADGIVVDPAFEALRPAPHEGPDLAPGPLEPPPSLAGASQGLALPVVGIAAGLPDASPPPASDLFGDGHGILYDGAALEAPLTNLGITGRARIPF